MKSRTVIILWVVAIVLGIGSYFVKFHGNNETTSHTTLSPGDKIFSSFPVENIATITLTQGEDSTQIVRTSQHEWGVANRENYPPDYELLKNLLGALHALKVTQGYPAKEENFGRFG
ncbi:MAG: hypothetical protein ACPGUY_05355, partial [Akkermansiaceae bacterium]